ncbi:UNVERIFIED_CONTAM: hypothetical protein RMT77_011444 [Armadillidium vulgare]
MTADKKICCGIMVCQMTAILSGVALMYLSVIVVIPSMKELEFNFHEGPIMCTTIKAVDIAAGGKKVDCKWSTCNEWCLSKTSSPCWQIYVMPRNIGVETVIGDCELETNEACSALNVSLTEKKLCKKGECKDLNGLFNCSKYDDNECRDIKAGYDCTGGSLKSLNKTPVVCDEEKCKTRLNGVYLCEKGFCQRVEGKESYLDCERKCENLNLANRNTLIFSNEKLLTGKCSFINSTSTELSNLIEDQNWINGNKYLFIFCSTAEGSKINGKTFFKMKDCFNATLRDKNDVEHIKSYLKLVDFKDYSPPNELLVGSEETLRIMNDTVLKINPEGCVNTLIKECQSFFTTHAKDGKDGRTPDRYPCYYTNTTGSFVIGKYDPKKTYLLLLLASTVPAVLFVVACCCLFFCSKSVGVDEAGHLKVTLLNKKGGAAPRNASEL